MIVQVKAITFLDTQKECHKVPKRRHLSKNKPQADWCEERAEKCLWSSQSQEAELPQAKRSPDMAFDRFLLKVVKGKLRENRDSHDCSGNLQQRETERLICRLRNGEKWGLIRGSDPGLTFPLWAPQAGWPGIAPGPAFSQSAPLHEHQVSATA